MALAWLVECKTCLLRFPVKPREAASGKSTDQLTSHSPGGRFECPHCHDVHEYSTDDFIPGESRTRTKKP
jgi:hypothetical protein